MKKKLKIKFWKAERALAMQILEQEGLPEKKMDGGFVIVDQHPDLYNEMVELRGILSHCNFKVANKHFSENQKRDEYLDKITQAITDELFTSDGELKVGEMCEVRHYKGCVWEKLKLLAILSNIQKYKYICEAKDDNTYFYSYAEARPICKRTEPKVETNGEIITYTWEEE